MAIDLSRLNDAAAAMLDPLLAPAEPAQVASRLAGALEHCAATADRLGLRGLNYLSALVSPFLRQRAADGFDAVDREHAERWVGELIAFCGGHLDRSRCAELVQSLAGWPRFAKVPPQFVELIGERLRSDAEAIASALGASGEPPAPEAPPPLGGERSADDAAPPAIRTDGSAPEPTTPASPGPLAASPLTVARDELDMLVEAAQSLSEDLVAQILGLEFPGAFAADGPGGDVLDEYAGRVQRMASAVRFIGLEGLADRLEVVRAWLEKVGSPAGALDADAGEDARRLLLLLPDTLGRYFGDPSVANGAELTALMADPLWAGTGSAAGAAILPVVRVVASRQVAERSAEVDEDDVSLDIPAEADRSVVDNLRRELPQLSAEFGEAVDGLRAGDRRQLERAQRIAHTLKGSANTVGVRGIANLTHQLEDILQLLVGGDRLPSRALGEHLMEASDCLADMCEAVAGVAPTPSHALGVYAETVHWANRLLRDGLDAGAQPPGGDLERPDAQGEGDVPSRRAQPIQGVDSVAERWVVGAAEPMIAGQGVAVTSAANAPAEDAAVVEGVAPEAAAVDSGAEPAEEEILRVPARIVDRLLDFASQAVIALAHVQEQLVSLDHTRAVMRVGSDRLLDLSAELERLVDVRGLALTGRTRDHAFDPLELDEYNDLHTVSRRIAEAGADNKLVDQQFDRQVMTLRDHAAILERAQTDLREAALRTRMVAVATIAGRLQRAARQAARMAGKYVELTIDGADTELDGQLLQNLVAPLTHLLRNAVDHGIEPEGERLRHGKPTQGQLRLAFARDGADLSIRCSDDGRGLDLAAIRARAQALGVLEDGQASSDAELVRLILLPGFSTRLEATQLSGRGIGLDVVNQALRQMRGRLDIDTVPGQGTVFTLIVPVRMAAVPVMVARTPTHVLGISVRDIEQIVPRHAPAADRPAGDTVLVGDREVPTVPLERLLGLPVGTFGGDGIEQVVLLVRNEAAQMLGVVAPEVGQTRNVILRPLPDWLAAVPGIAGTAVLGDGSVAPVLDLPTLVRAQRERASDTVTALELPASSGPVCLVVDDSVSVRRSMELFLRDLGFQVDVAGDGLEALECLDKRRPDLAIVDLEMPRMNGVELAAALRASPASASVPIIMITSRFSDKHKQAALAAGVDVFLTKPYTEDDLAAQIQRCLYRASA
jgi:chemosensory pili system protein ChpA (sensor histidine kinase/response regulator)